MKQGLLLLLLLGEIAVAGCLPKEDGNGVRAHYQVFSAGQVRNVWVPVPKVEVGFAWVVVLWPAAPQIMGPSGQCDSLAVSALLESLLVQSGWPQSALRQAGFERQQEREGYVLGCRSEQLRHQDGRELVWLNGLGLPARWREGRGEQAAVWQLAGIESGVLVDAGELVLSDQPGSKPAVPCVACGGKFAWR